MSNTFSPGLPNPVLVFNAKDVPYESKKDRYFYDKARFLQEDYLSRIDPKIAQLGEIFLLYGYRDLNGIDWTILSSPHAPWDIHIKSFNRTISFKRSPLDIVGIRITTDQKIEIRNFAIPNSVISVDIGDLKILCFTL